MKRRRGRTAGAVLVCRLNRPAALNGLTGALLGEYLGLLADARTDDAVRVVVTTGEGDAFSAGADVSDLSGETASHGLNALLHERLGLTDTLRTADRAFDRLGIGRETLAIMNYDKPLIAAVNGAAAGGGFALAMLHDIRLVSERATFTKRIRAHRTCRREGLSCTLPRAIGLEAAMDVMYTGRSVNADEAQALGLVRRVVPHERLVDEVMAYAEQIGRNPHRVQFAKRALVVSLSTAPLRLQLELEVVPYQVAAFETDDAREGHRRVLSSVGNHGSVAASRASTKSSVTSADKTIRRAGCRSRPRGPPGSGSHRSSPAACRSRGRGPPSSRLRRSSPAA